MPLDRKYYAKEPKPAPIPNPRLEASRKILKDSQKRFSRIQDSRAQVSDQPDRSGLQPVMRLAPDDEIDVWHRQSTLRPQPSMTEFSVVSLGDEYDDEHTVPCGDRQCDHCYVLSVVSEFDEEDDSIDLYPLVQPVHTSLDAILSKPIEPLRFSHKATQDSLKPRTLEVSSVARVTAEIPSVQSLELGVDGHEAYHDCYHTKPSNGSSIEPTQEALDEYMRSYSRDKQQGRASGLFQSRETAGNSRPQLGRVMSTKHSSIEKNLRSPLDRLQDKLTCVSVAAEAQGREVSPALLTILTPSSNGTPRSSSEPLRTTTYRWDKQVSAEVKDWLRVRALSPEGTWADETQRLIRRTSESSNPALIAPERVAFPVEHKARPITRSQSTRYTPPAKSLQRTLSFRERVARMSLSSGTALQDHGHVSEASIPKIGKGSRPPLSGSSRSIAK